MRMVKLLHRERATAHRDVAQYNPLPALRLRRMLPLETPARLRTVYPHQRVAHRKIKDKAKHLSLKAPSSPSSETLANRILHSLQIRQ